MKSHENKMMMSMQEMNDKIDSIQMTGEVDHDFAEMMVVHHQAAVDMANAELNSGSDRFLKNLAERIIIDQSKEIKELQQWLQKHK